MNRDNNYCLPKEAVMTQYRKPETVLASKKSAFVGIDVHKSSWYVTVLVDGLIVFRGSIPAEYRHLRRLFDRLPDCEIQVVYEAGACGFGLYDLLENDDIRCTVVAPSLLEVQPGRRVKVDRIDSRKLARDLADGRLKSVFVFTAEERANRDLVRTRQQVRDHRANTMRQIKSKLLFHGIRISCRSGWSKKYVATLRNLDYPFPTLRTAFLALLDLFEFLSEQLAALDREIKALSETEPYASRVQLLVTVPGIGLLTAMIVATELGDLSRFSSNDSLAAFLGLTPSEYSTGERIRKGRITRCGNERVRTALIESSWTLIRYDAGIRRKYQRIAIRAPKKAIVAVAHTLSGRIRHMLITGEKYKVAA
jgi:transposase